MGGLKFILLLLVMTTTGSLGGVVPAGGGTGNNRVTEEHTHTTVEFTSSPQEGGGEGADGTWDGRMRGQQVEIAPKVRHTKEHAAELAANQVREIEEALDLGSGSRIAGEQTTAASTAAGAKTFQPPQQDLRSLANHLSSQQSERLRADYQQQQHHQQVASTDPSMSASQTFGQVKPQQQAPPAPVPATPAPPAPAAMPADRSDDVGMGGSMDTYKPKSEMDATTTAASGGTRVAAPRPLFWGGGFFAVVFAGAFSVLQLVLVH